MAKIQLVDGHEILVEESFAKIQNMEGKVLTLHLKTGELVSVHRKSLAVVQDVPQMVGWRRINKAGESYGGIWWIT